MFGAAISMFEPEHRALLRRGAEAFVASIPLAETRRLRESGEFNRGRLQEVGDLGWLGLSASEDPEIGLHEMVAVHRELGRGVLPEPLVATGVLCPMIAAGGSTAQSKMLLEALCSGRATASLAWQADPGALGSNHVGVSAKRSGNSWCLSGRALYVPWAGKVDHLLVAAKVADGILLSVIAPTASGVTVRDAAAVDRASFCDILFDNGMVHDDQMIATGQKGASLLDSALDVARLALSAELIGMTEALFHITLQYLKQRKQFGRTLGSNQALQFIAVDLFSQIELANSALRHTCDQMSEATGAAERARVAAGCKIRANDVALIMAKQAIQLHGAIGYTDECDVSLFVKRAFTTAAWLGTSSALRNRLAQIHPLSAS